jgi:hypothetical protein
MYLLGDAMSTLLSKDRPLPIRAAQCFRDPRVGAMGFASLYPTYGLSIDGMCGRCQAELEEIELSKKKGETKLSPFQ